MSNLAQLVLCYKNNPHFASGLSAEFRAECLRALAARLVAGEYEEV
jgi:hypothetical protein